MLKEDSVWLEYFSIHIVSPPHRPTAASTALFHKVIQAASTNSSEMMYEIKPTYNPKSETV